MSWKEFRSAIAADLLDTMQTAPDGVIYIVGRMVERKGKAPEIHIQGASLKRANAVAMCTDETYFVGPLPVDVLLPHKPVAWPGVFFPLKKKADE